MDDVLVQRVVRTQPRLDRRKLAVRVALVGDEEEACIELPGRDVYPVGEGVATPEAVDEVFKLGMNHPMGPLTLADFIGLDVCLDIMRVLHNGLGDPKYRPCPLLVKMVDAGWLGKKSRRGFYNY